MKRSETLSFIILILLSSISSAQQDDEWRNNIVFQRLFKNNKMISNFYQDKKDEGNIYGKISSIDDQQQKIFEIVKYDIATNQMRTITKGPVSDLKINSYVKKEEKLFIYEMSFNWKSKNLKDGKIREASVFERQIVNLEIDQIFTTVDIVFKDTKEDLYGWSEETIEQDADQNRFTLPIFLKIKRISLSNNEDIDDPESKINYAFWTKDGFYRYALNGEKDKITFSRMTDSISTTGYNTIIAFENNKGENYMYMNNFLSDNKEAYVSTLDVNPFPIDAVKPTITPGHIIVWEKYTILTDLYSTYIKQNYISTKGFSLKELNAMEDKMELLREIIKDRFNIE